MAKVTRHLTTRIAYLLKQTNEKLGYFFEGDGAEIRAALEHRAAHGELLIGSEGCEGFNPVTGCPGHPCTE